MGGGIEPTYQSVWGSAAPSSAHPAGGAILVSDRIRFDVAGLVLAVRYYRQAADNGNHFMWLRKIGPGDLLAARVFPRYNPVGSQPARWEVKYLTPTVRVAAADVLQVVLMSSADYVGQMVAPHSGDTDYTVGDLTVPADATGAPNGATATTLTFNPQGSAGAAKWAVDVYFLPD